MRALVSLAMWSLLTASSPADTTGALEMPDSLRAFLETPTWDATPGGFRIITLSHVADACAAQAERHPSRREGAQQCVRRALAAAWKTMPAKSLAEVPNGLWLAHLNLIFADADALGPCADPRTHRWVSERLAAMSLNDPLGHAPSYGAFRARWPADQAAALASLARYDHAHHATLHERPTKVWLAALAKATGRPKGAAGPWVLPPSDVAMSSATAKFARGCANSFLTRYTAEFAPDVARDWYREFRDGWVVHAGPFTGLREWPPGVTRPADIDSGPVILNIGTAASALGIAAARAQGDEAFATTLEASAAQVMALGVTGALPKLLMADAISFESRWQPVHLAGSAGE